MLPSPASHPKPKPTNPSPPRVGACRNHHESKATSKARRQCVWPAFTCPDQSLPLSLLYTFVTLQQVVECRSVLSRCLRSFLLPMLGAGIGPRGYQSIAFLNGFCCHLYFARWLLNGSRVCCERKMTFCRSQIGWGLAFS